MERPIIFRGGYRWISISILSAGIFASAFVGLIKELRDGALPIFLISFIISLLIFLDSLMPIVKIGEERLTFYTGFLKSAPTITLDWYNIDSVQLVERDRKVKLKMGLLIGSITGEITEEVLLLKLKAPPEISALNKLRYMRDSSSPYHKYALGDSDREILLRLPPKAGFNNLLKKLSNRINIDR